MLDLTRIMVRSSAAIWFSQKEISSVNANAAKHSFKGNNKIQSLFTFYSYNNLESSVIIRSRFYAYCHEM